MPYDYLKIKISEIKLDQNNPRFPPVASQRDAINAMIDDQGDKIYALASDIYNFGLDPSKRLIVFKENNQFIDGDGNSRLTALKILETPKLIERNRLYDKFIHLINSKGGLKFDEIDCVVFESRDSIRHWLEINHGGELDGKGQIPWNAEQKERFNGKKSTGLLAKDFLLKNKKITEQEYDNVNVTTLSRLLDSKPGQEILGISKTIKGLNFSNIELLVLAYKKLIGKSVKEVYHDSDRKKFLSDLKNVNDSGNVVNSTSNNIVDVNVHRTHRKNKTSVIIFGEVLNLKPGLVNNLYRDICDIYKLHQTQKGFEEILGFSMRLILDVAAREFYKNNPKVNQKQDALYKEYLKLLKDSVDQKEKNTISLDRSIKNLLEEENVEALLGKLAHGSINTTIEMILSVSLVIGYILKIHFSKDSQS